MLIKYSEDLEYEEGPDVLEGGTNDFVPTFEVVSLAYDEEFVYGKVFGNIDNFMALNTNVSTFQYETIDNLPSNNISYYTNKKFKTPGSVREAIKLKTRSRIEDEIGDNEDLISDLSKRVTMLERLLIRMTDELIKNIPEHVPNIITAYKPLVDGYLYLLSVYGDEATTADLEDPNELFIKLFDRNVDATKIVKFDYKAKMDAMDAEEAL